MLAKACVCGGLLIASAAPAAQEGGPAATGQVPQSPATRVVETTYPTGGLAPSRLVLTRTVSDDREAVVEVLEAPGLDGRPTPVRQVVTEIVRPALDPVRTTRDVFAFTAGLGRRLLKRTEETQAYSGAQTTTVLDTSIPDPDGRLFLTSRRIENTTTLGPEALEGEATLLLPSPDESLREAERTRFADRPIDPALRRQESSRMVRDVNGRWQEAESLVREVRAVGPTERIEEETLQRPDVSGRLALSARSVTRRTTANGREDVVVETYARDDAGRVRSDSLSSLSRRVQTGSTATADGGRVTVEEVEERNPVATGDPLRLVRRTVTTIRPAGPGRWSTERQVFERDPNGRLVPVVREWKQ